MIVDTTVLMTLDNDNKERIVSFWTTCQKALMHYTQHYRFEN